MSAAVILRGECISLRTRVPLIHIVHLPRSARASRVPVAPYRYIERMRWRLTYKTPGLEESIIAPLTLLLRPPHLALLPSLINRPAPRGSILQLSSLSA